MKSFTHSDSLVTSNIVGERPAYERCRCITSPYLQLTNYSSSCFHSKLNKRGDLRSDSRAGFTYSLYNMTYHLLSSTRGPGNKKTTIIFCSIEEQVYNIAGADLILGAVMHQRNVRWEQCWPDFRPPYHCCERNVIQGLQTCYLQTKPNWESCWSI